MLLLISFLVSFVAAQKEELTCADNNDCDFKGCNVKGLDFFSCYEGVCYKGKKDESCDIDFKPTEDGGWCFQGSATNFCPGYKQKEAQCVDDPDGDLDEAGGCEGFLASPSYNCDFDLHVFDKVNIPENTLVKDTICRVSCGTCVPSEDDKKEGEDDEDKTNEEKIEDATCEDDPNGYLTDAGGCKPLVKENGCDFDMSVWSDQIPKDAHLKWFCRRTCGVCDEEPPTWAGGQGDRGDHEEKKLCVDHDMGELGTCPEFLEEMLKEEKDGCMFDLHTVIPDQAPEGTYVKDHACMKSCSKNCEGLWDPMDKENQIDKHFKGYTLSAVRKIIDHKLNSPFVPNGLDGVTLLINSRDNKRVIDTTMVGGDQSDWFDGTWGKDKRVNIASCSKPVSALTVLYAITETNRNPDKYDKVLQLETTVEEVLGWPRVNAEGNMTAYAATVEHFLSFASGLSGMSLCTHYGDNLQECAEQESQFAALGKPGEQFAYEVPGGTHLRVAAAMAEKAMGMKFSEIFDMLKAELGMVNEDLRFCNDALGLMCNTDNPALAKGLYATAEEMIRFVMLLPNGGRDENGKQIIEEKYIARMKTAKYNKIRNDFTALGLPYGLGLMPYADTPDWNEKWESGERKTSTWYGHGGLWGANFFAFEGEGEEYYGYIAAKGSLKYTTDINALMANVANLADFGTSLQFALAPEIKKIMAEYYKQGITYKPTPMPTETPKNTKGGCACRKEWSYYFKDYEGCSKTFDEDEMWCRIDPESCDAENVSAGKEDGDDAWDWCTPAPTAKPTEEITTVTCSDISDKKVCKFIRHCKYKKKECQNAYEPLDCSSLKKKDCRQGKKQGCLWVQKPKADRGCYFKGHQDGCEDFDGEEACKNAKEVGFCDKNNELNYMFSKVCAKTCGGC